MMVYFHFSLNNIIVSLVIYALFVSVILVSMTIFIFFRELFFQW